MSEKNSPNVGRITLVRGGVVDIRFDVRSLILKSPAGSSCAARIDPRRLRSFCEARELIHAVVQASTERSAELDSVHEEITLPLRQPSALSPSGRSYS